MTHDSSVAIEAIETSLREAERYCDKYHYQGQDGNEFDSFKYYVERAFIELLVLADRLHLAETYRMARELFDQATVDGFGKTDSYEGEPYPRWTGRIRLLADAIASAHGMAKTAQTELSDLKTVLKKAVYTICDTALFGGPPACEADVHARLEGIMRCLYGDLVSKPSLAKPIKNFIPDTGLPSAKTLIEYKFISNKTDAKRVADEILADASGYRSRDWHSLLFVIYETRRVKPEEEWQQLLQACELRVGYDAVVLSGEARGRP